MQRELQKCLRSRAVLSEKYESCWRSIDEMVIKHGRLYNLPCDEVVGNTGMKYSMVRYLRLTEKRLRLQ